MIRFQCSARMLATSLLLTCLLWALPVVAMAQDTFPSGANQPATLFQPTAQHDSSDHGLRTWEQTAPTGGGARARSGIEELVPTTAEEWTSNQGLAGSLRVMLTVSVLSLAPAILLMTTCYVRIVVVLGLLRQALGAGQLPPTQVITSISLFMTLFVMMPVWNRVYNDAVKPYTEPGSTMSADEAWNLAVVPVREFMTRQIETVGNEDDVHLFYAYHSKSSQPASNWNQVPLHVLLPAYVLSELKTAFLMGFMIFLPFLVIDLVVASVTVSMGMMMLPPAMISLPFKLLLFVLVDGWHLVVGMLLESFGPIP